MGTNAAGHFTMGGIDMSGDKQSMIDQLTKQYPQAAPLIQKKFGGGATPTPPSTVPTAAGGFNTELTPDARAKLLQTMIDRSRGGPGQPATGTMTAPPASNPNVVIK